MSKSNNNDVIQWNINGEAFASNVSSVSTYDPREVRKQARASRIAGRSAGKAPVTSNSVGMTYTSLNGTQAIQECLEVYEKVGIVKNVIDLMADFATEGIEFTHENAKQNAFWEVWRDKAKIQDTINKMTISLLAGGACITERIKSKLSKTEEKDLQEGRAAFKNESRDGRNIPIRYRLHNPAAMKYSPMNEKGEIPVRMSTTGRGNKRIDTDPNYFIDYYKKQDWSACPIPFHYAALEDLAFENKMQRMDDSAMDGVINSVRIWKLGGELSNGTPIFPDAGATKKLAQILQNDTGGGVLDIIWDKYIDLKVEYPPVKDILGSDKYKHIRQKIFEDFGIAEILIDGTGQGSYSSQYLSVSSLIEKLEYLREIIRHWLIAEVKYTAKNLGMKKLPLIKFKHINLSDKNAERSLVVQLYDRGIMSKEQTLNYFDEDSDIEKMRIKNEYKEAEKEDSLKKKGPFDQEKDTGSTIGDDGRPENSPDDKTQKKKRTTKPQGASLYGDEYSIVALQEEAKTISKKIDELVDPIYFAKCGVKHIKQLKKDDRNALEAVKIVFLQNAESVNSVNTSFLKELYTADAKKLDNSVSKEYGKLLNDYKNIKGKSPNKEMQKTLRNSAWAICQNRKK